MIKTKKRYLANPDDSIFNYFILPLIGLNKESFGVNFKKTLLNKLSTMVYVKVNEFIINFNNNPNFLYTTKDYYVFTIPVSYIEEAKKISSGKYSKLKETTKDLIRNKSGLANNTLIDGQYVTSKALLALSKHPALIEHYATDLGLTPNQTSKLIIKPSTELLDRPFEDDFIENYNV